MVVVAAAVGTAGAAGATAIGVVDVLPVVVTNVNVGTRVAVVHGRNGELAP